SNLPLGSCWRRRESLSRVSLQSLSTRHGFCGFFSKVHSPQSLMLTHFSTSAPGSLAMTMQLLLTGGVRPSLAVPVTVMVLPTSAFVALSVAVEPLPLNWPPVAGQLWVNGHPCGSLAAMVMVEGSPTAIVVGLAEQLTTGGCGSLMVKGAAHFAEFIFFIFGSVTVKLAE